MVLLGGPFHGTLRWVKEFKDAIEEKNDPNDESELGNYYVFAFGDAYTGIYYWRLSPFQVKAIQNQVEHLRARHNDYPSQLL